MSVYKKNKTRGGNEARFAKLTFVFVHALKPQVVVLSDRLAGPDRLPIPSLLATGAVHQHLLQTQQRPKAALFTEAGDAREVRRRL